MSESLLYPELQHRFSKALLNGLSPRSAASHLQTRPAASMRGFTLVELIVVIVILGILAAVALPKFMRVDSSARASSINGLAGSVRSAMALVHSQVLLRGPGTADPDPSITWVKLDDGTQVRMWNGYPDRWCDGIGALQQGMTPPSGGCYRSSGAVQMDAFTFYGYGNTSIPNGVAGWRIESARTPKNCSIQYSYDGADIPVVTVITSGC